LLIVALSFSAVIMYIIGCSSCRPRFSSELFFTQVLWIWMHAHRARFRSFMLNCLQCSGGCVVCLYHVPTMRKRKLKFVDELKSKYLCFRYGCDQREGKCCLCKPGTCMSVWTRCSWSSTPCGMQGMFTKKCCVMEIYWLPCMLNLF
jgi:hypothetical protein